MRVTTIGHAGILIETSAGSILCDPWFQPAFFGSWFVFPRNDQLGTDLLERIYSADFLYISHLHGDHHDGPWLRTHLRRDIPILLPGFSTREQQRTLTRLGFNNFVRTADTVEHEIAPGLQVAIHIESSIIDGPGGDSALVVIADDRIVVDQNDCRPPDPGQLRSHGPVDLHALQFSGAIWYPLVYEMDSDAKLSACRAKVEAQFARTMRYVEKIKATSILPSAGPPAFLDPDLFGFNMITGDEPSIFPDQTVFLSRLHEAGFHGVMNVPGTTIDLDRPATCGAGWTVTHPMTQADVQAIFDNKLEYLIGYQADWLPWLDEMKASWASIDMDLLTTLQAWWEPLMKLAPTLCERIGANVVLRAMGDPTAGLEQLDIVVDFLNGEVREHADEPFDFRFDVDRRLVEAVVAEGAADWSNSLLLSCRFTAWRSGEFNEYLYNFLKSLSRERMKRTEAEAIGKTGLLIDEMRATETDVRVGDYVVQRRCPHRDADLKAFGEIDVQADGTVEFVCTLHGWRFDCETGTCLTSPNEIPLRIRRA